MRKLILFFLLLAGTAYGQTSNTTNTKFTNGLAVPNGATPKPTTGLTPGALAFVTDSGLHVYDGSAWVKVGTGDGGVTSFNSRTGAVLPDSADYATFYVPMGRTITINGVTYDLSANRTWTIAAVMQDTLKAGYGLTGDPFNGSSTVTWVADTASDDGLVSKERLGDTLALFVPKATTITINGTTYNLSTNRSYSVGTVTSVNAVGGTGISISGAPIIDTGTVVITNTAPDQTVTLTGGTGISTSGSYPDFTITNTSPDQTVTLNPGTGITTGGTYPNFTITNSAPSPSSLPDSLTKKANRTFDNVASGAIANVKLANSTISGVALGSNLNALTLGNGLTGTSYNGSSAITARADTAVVQTVSNFFPKGDTRYQRTSERTTVGNSFYTLTNPSAITFPRINANNTVSALSASDFRTAIGAGTSSTNGTVTSVAATVPTGLTISGSPITTSGTLSVGLQSGYSIPTTAKQAQWDTAYGWGDFRDYGLGVSSNFQDYDAVSTNQFINSGNNAPLALSSGISLGSNGRLQLAGRINSFYLRDRTSGSGWHQIWHTGNFTPSDYIPLSQKSANNGVASLDASGKVPFSQLPTSNPYQGTWDASTNTPTLADGVGTAGDYYRVAVAGTQNLGSGNITFSVGDDVIYSGTIWQRVPGGSVATNLAVGTRTTTTVPITNSNGTGLTLPIATTSLAGVMSSADKTKLDNIAPGATDNTGTVESVAATVPTGLTVSGSPITTSGTLAFGLQSGYSIPTTAKQGQWDTAYSWGDFRGYGLGGLAVDISSLADFNDLNRGTSFLRVTNSDNTPFSGTGMAMHIQYSVGNMGQLWFSRASDLLQWRVATSGAWGSIKTAADVDWVTSNFTNNTGTVTSVGISGSNGIGVSSSPVTTSGTIALSLGAITPTSVTASGTVTGSNLSGTNTGDQTNITGNAGTATKLATARTIAGVSFDGTANISLNNNAITNGAGYITSSAITGKEDVSNKSTSTSLGTSNTLYPSQNAVKTYVDSAFNFAIAATKQLYVRYSTTNSSSVGPVTLDDFNIPLTALTNNGDKVTFFYGGEYGATGNNKLIQLIIGGDVALSQMSNANGLAWELSGTIIKQSTNVYRAIIKWTQGAGASVTYYTGLVPDFNPLNIQLYTTAALNDVSLHMASISAQSAP